MEKGAVFFAMAMLGGQPDKIAILDEQKKKGKDKDNLVSGAVFVSGAAPISTAAETEEKPFNGDIYNVLCLDCGQQILIKNLVKGCPCNQWSKCQIFECGKVFTTIQNRRKHVKHAHGDRPHACTWDGCDYRASQAGRIKVHERTHTGEKPYVCTSPGCDYRASQAGALKRHTKTHIGEKPCVCTSPGCCKVFATLSNLKRHMRTHTGVKPTGICGKRPRK